MKYKNLNIEIPADQREEVNKKIIYISRTGDHRDITPEEIFNCFTGKGGLHGLNYADYNDYYLFSSAKKEIEIGQFFTPPEICAEMVQLIKPGEDDLIADLTVGKGSFFNFLPVESNCYGCDIDGDAVNVARYLFPDAHLDIRDIRYYQPATQFNVIFGNPPYNLNIAGWNSQYYYCLKASELLKPGGFLVILVPESFLNDEFQGKWAIQKLDNLFNFILQYRVSYSAFKNLGVTNFKTKVVVFQRKSDHLPERPYKIEFMEGDKETLHKEYIRPLLLENQSQRARMYLELRGQSNSREDEKVIKLLYDIKVNPKTRPKYQQCLEYYHKYKTQEKPYNIDWNEWEKNKITENKVLSYFRRVLSTQHEVERDEIRLVKTKGKLRLKAYSGKTKYRLSRINGQKEWNINQLILNGENHINFPVEDFKTNYSKRLRKKIREYRQQDQKFSQMNRNPGIDIFLRNYRFIDNGETQLLNEVQVADMGLILQKRYAILNWQQGSGKTPATYAWIKYQQQNTYVRNIIIIAPALAANNTWKPFLKKNGANFIFVKNRQDVANIERNQIVLISLSMLLKFKKEIKRYIKMQSRKVGLVFDESDEVTNHSAKRSRAVLDCFRRVRVKLLATGTTTRNNIAELYTQLELLYNNSINMVNDCPFCYHEHKTKKGTEIIKKPNELKGKPFPAFRGQGVFNSCFNPVKTKVFGIKAQNQDIYNPDSLRQLIEKTIITRKFREIAGEDKYKIVNNSFEMKMGETEVYRKIIDELHIMVTRYYRSTGNARKDTMLRLLRQMNMLIRATSMPQKFSEYISNEMPTKSKEIINIIRKNSDEKIAIGCLTIEAAEYYRSIISQLFQDREVFYITGSCSFKGRERIIKTFEETRNGILISTQQSLKSSVNIPSCNRVIIESLPWNFPKLEQYYFRFIRFNSTGTTEIHFVTYRGSIEQNLLALLMAKERLNDFVKTLEIRSYSEIYDQHEFDLGILEEVLTREYDKDGRSYIKWGRQEII